jgi:CubicO group peptidase (beta-lactamase class C family)
VIGAIQLVEETRLSLNDPVEKYLPAFKGAQVYVGDKDGVIVAKKSTKKILVEHLLTHTAGLTYYFMPSPLSRLYKEAGLSGTAKDTRYENMAAWTASVGSMPLLAEPGDSWNYSVGLDILGHLVEVVSGLFLGNFLESNLFAPLGMTDTGFWVEPSDTSRLSSLYALTNSGIVLVESREEGELTRPPALEMGGAGLVGTASDYLRFAQMLLNYGELDGVRVLSRESVTQIISNRLPASMLDGPLSTLTLYQPELACDGLGFGYAGFVVIGTKSSCLALPAGSYGWSGAASTYFWIDPDSGVVAIFMSQVLGAGRYQILVTVACAVYPSSCEEK